MKTARSIIKSIMIIAILSAQIATVAYCQDTKQVMGEILTIDKTHDTITIRWLENIQTLTYDEMIFTVHKDTKVSRGSEPSTLDHLNIGDRVTVRYIHLDYNWPKAVSILVKP